MTWRTRAVGLRSAVLCAAALGWPGAGQAMMPSTAYEDALAAADTHVQIAVTTRDLIKSAGRSEAGHGLCRLGGNIVTVFRGASRPGSKISISIPCRHEGTDVPAGGTIFASVARLATARFLEVVLIGRAKGAFEVAGHGMGLSIISEPSGEPVIGAAAGKGVGSSDGRVEVEP